MRAVALVAVANADAALTQHEEVPVIVGVEPALVVDGERSVGGNNREVGEELRLGRSEDGDVTLIEHIEVAVLTRDVDVADAVNGRRVDAPLEAIRVQAVIDTDDCPVRIPVAGTGLSTQELPLRNQVRVQLSDVEGSGRDPGGIADGQTYSRTRVSGKAVFLVLAVVLHHDRVAAAFVVR